ncbi:hypothetical protein, conserved [Babesia bigemina]|uniref:Uncharacterized protein n=1 Tax=Babesia bigemina TaxID=5866 RepID=A0A061DBM1_BABBI|nr:hypothetical protein, conserved [Babesia bigemina]CDR95145.1 hypothetical protein, conserved [Babesia bigemina]|eukprot:XP_012767331.1 hypothetical protein, conserved [Babesia bigemina]
MGCVEASSDCVVPSDTQVVGLCDVDLKCLVDEEESTCSPFSNPPGLRNSESIFSDDPNYLWFVKQRAEMLRGPSVSSRGNLCRCASDVDSDAGSTCVMVNIQHDTCVNLCDNPSDMWHGLKMSDGTPVVIRSKRPRARRYVGKKCRVFGAEGEATSRTAADVSPAAANNGLFAGLNGPINYGAGFLSLQNYVGRGNGASVIYRVMQVDARLAHSSRRKEIRVRQRRQHVQQHLAKARGIMFKRGTGTSAR